MIDLQSSEEGVMLRRAIQEEYDGQNQSVKLISAPNQYQIRLKVIGNYKV